MKPFKRAGAASALALVVSLGLCAGAQAATLFIQTNDYGSDTGKVNPGGTDVLGADFVTVSDQSSGRFNDSFSFGTALGTITQIDVTLAFEDAGPSKGVFGCLFGECWDARITGSDSSGIPSESSDDLFVELEDVLSAQTISLSSATDTGSIDAFSHSVGTGKLELWFAENALGARQFDLDYATVEVLGTAAPIPLPAAGWLLLSAFGGLGLMARRRARRPEARSMFRSIREGPPGMPGGLFASVVDGMTFSTITGLARFIVSQPATAGLPSRVECPTSLCA